MLLECHKVDIRFRLPLTLKALTQSLPDSQLLGSEYHLLKKRNFMSS